MSKDEKTPAPEAPTRLVTVAQTEGSTPREPGTRMLVQRDAVTGTIGGGHLELKAIDIARTMLANGTERHLERIALGPSLGQCCGGVMHLAFERADPAHLALLKSGHDGWRVVALDGASERELLETAPSIATAPDTHVVAIDQRRWLLDRVRAPHDHLLLFGAGHVGAAVIRALADLPCTVTWIDERDDLFPRDVPANVTVEASDTPEALIAAAPDGASYLVMTHSHALDQRLTEAILARANVFWFGLIGSLTKRRQFEHRLRARGVPEPRISAMVCPIGLPGITNKAPAVIAASVSAQLLMAWQGRADATQDY